MGTVQAKKTDEGSFAPRLFHAGIKKGMVINMKRAILIVTALLLTACLSMASWLTVYYMPNRLEYKELDFDEYEMNGDVLTVRVSAKLDGVYLYRVGAKANGDELELTFRGGKQPALAQSKNKSEAVFRITVPPEVKRVVCGTHTLYTVR